MHILEHVLQLFTLQLCMKLASWHVLSKASSKHIETIGVSFVQGHDAADPVHMCHVSKTRKNLKESKRIWKISDVGVGADGAVSCGGCGVPVSAVDPPGCGHSGLGYQRAGQQNCPGNGTLYPPRMPACFCCTADVCKLCFAVLYPVPLERSTAPPRIFKRSIGFLETIRNALQRCNILAQLETHCAYWEIYAVHENVFSETWKGAFF